MRTTNLALGGAAAVAVALAVGVALADPGTAEPGTTPSPATDAPSAGQSRGYPATAAYCDDSQTPVASGRTARALVAICRSPDGELEYRGARLSDLASITMPAGRTSDGAIVATNDGVTYVVSPVMLLVSEGDSVLYREEWVEFTEVADSPDSDAGSATTTVSTTTVTLPPDR